VKYAINSYYSVTQNIVLSNTFVISYLRINQVYLQAKLLALLGQNFHIYYQQNVYKLKKLYMCFSSEASFIGGAIISTIGIATIRKVHKPGQIVFASIPLFFGIQQFGEGFLWLALQHPEFAGIQRFATYWFLIMAEVFWPFMVPLATLLMEENKKKIRILQVLLVIGISVSLYFLYCLIMFNVSPEIRGNHIKYVEDFPKSVQLFVFGCYLIASIVPLFVSSINRIYILGILMSISCLVTIVFFTQYLTSVWCFFGAIISIVILWLLRDARRKYLLGR